MKTQTSFIRLLLASNIALLAFLTFFVMSSFNKNEPDVKYRELTAERINIVNQDGTPVMVISNKQRIAGPVIGGKKYPVSTSEGREYMAGIIFFNETGDEMGGLVFNSFKMPNGRIAGIGHLSFDRFNDNQTISLEYNENRNGVKSGLAFFDRPGDGSFKKSLDLIEEANQKTTSPERLTSIKDSLKHLNQTNKLGAQRVFIGSKNEIAQLELKDNRGVVKGRFYVNAKGEAKLEFLNEKGEVIQEFPKP